MNHTPGPWFYSGDSLTHRQFDIYAPAQSPNQHIATVNNLSVEKLRTRDAKEAEGNARLIAAAPDLAWALERMLREHDALQMASGSTEDRWEAATYARVTLAKARGE